MITTSWFIYEFTWENIEEGFWLMVLCTVPNFFVFLFMKGIRKLSAWILEKISKNISPCMIPLVSDAMMSVIAVTLMIVYNHTLNLEDLALYAFGVQLPVFEILVMMFYVVLDWIKFIKQRKEKSV